MRSRDLEMLGDADAAMADEESGSEMSYDGDSFTENHRLVELRHPFNTPLTPHMPPNPPQPYISARWICGFAL